MSTEDTISAQELIVHQSKRILKLEKELEYIDSTCDHILNKSIWYETICRDVADILEYNGFYKNLPEVLKAKLKKLDDNIMDNS